MALIPAGYMKAIVSLGTLGESFFHLGTGFLYHHPVGETDGITHYRPFLVTNKHVLDLGISHVRFNHPIDGSLLVHPLATVTTDQWTTHQDGADVAVVPIRSPGPLTIGRDAMAAEIFIGDVTTPSARDLGSISEGNGVFLIGFPLGLVGGSRNFPIVRSGIIARIQDWLAGEEDSFLIDAPAFPGNSGGPVITRPETAAVKDTDPIIHALLIGMVSHYIPHEDVAVSSQTGKPRVVFVDNTGLSEVVPIDAIKDTLKSVASS